LAPTATLVVGWIHSLKNRSWSIFPYQLNSEDRAAPLVPVAPAFRPATPAAFAGAILTGSFLLSSLVFFFSADLMLVFGEGFGVAFASAGFFAVGLGLGFAVGLTDDFGTGVGVTLRFGEGVATGTGEGVGVESWMSLSADGSGEGSVSSGVDGGTSGGAVASGALSVVAAEPTAATSPPIQTMLCKSGFPVARLQRTSPIMTTMCATAMIVTLRQKRASRGIGYFVSAFVAIPTFEICARWMASIKAINFCTGSSRSGRMTTATSGFSRFNSVRRAMRVGVSTD